MQRNPPDTNCRPARKSEFGRGEVLYRAGEEGGAWRVLAGSVRLDREDADGPVFAGLSLMGDVIGAETLLFGKYSYTARALSHSVVEPWGASSESQSLVATLMKMLAATERRMAKMLAIRSGRADVRVSGLLAMLGGVEGPQAGGFDLPRLRDIAEITGLTIETVSRTINVLNETGVVEIAGQRRDRWVGPLDSPRRNDGKS